MIDYESPITQIVSDMQMGYENGVLKAVQNVGFNVNKEELTKALLYDREQYQKGYVDGLNADKWIPCSERMPENDFEDVLVWFEYFRYGNYQRPYQMHGISYTFHGEWSGFVNGTSGWQQLKIIAWQPLPAPYQKGE